ncbi:MAG: hypothetical protein ACRDJ3_07635, partial [Solirubrobacteraceae bacterium]
RIGLAVGAAAIAIAVVVVSGLMVRAPLTRVPENTLKLIVGVMLTSFGVFWGAEGAGAHWPGGDAAVLAIIPSVLAVAVAISTAVRRTARRDLLRVEQLNAGFDQVEMADPGDNHRIWKLPLTIWEMILGNDWITIIGVALSLAVTALAADRGVAAWWIIPSTVSGLLALSTRRTLRQERWSRPSPEHVFANSRPGC